MEQPGSQIGVYLEIGKKRTFAGALDWPGWCRSGRDEQAALQALFDYGPRYASVLRTAAPDFKAPTHLEVFSVLERLEGTPTTDFGAPDRAPSQDDRPVDAADLLRFPTLLDACWQKFDAVVPAAAGKDLRKGPRGGGREVDEIIQHVAGVEEAYLGRLGWAIK